jgi:cation diffusion facilitator family transporter
MTDLLVKLFIRDYKNTDNAKVRTSYGILSSLVGIACNMLLFVIKLSIGFIIHSISIMADAFNNLSDAASSIISFIGVKLAGRPADKEHPFGHGRFEYISALAVAVLILIVGFNLLTSSFQKILNPEDMIFNPVLVGILVLSVLIKVWMALFNRKLGKRIKSNVMLATSADSRNDVVATSATIISLLIIGLFGINLDGYIGVLVSLFVMISGFKIAKETLEPLLGQAIDRELYQKIADMVESYEDICGTHDLIIHNYGPTHLMATIHAEVPSSIGFERAHETIDRIERDVLEKLDIFLVIHMDPIEVNDTMVLEKKEMVLSIIKKLEPQASIHDFRLVNGELQINLIFDLVIPFSYNKSEGQKLLSKIVEEVRKQDIRYQCVITMENSFVAEE